MVMQIRRTPTPNNPPATLAEGQLAVEMDAPLRLWCGVPTALDASGRKLLVPTGTPSGTTPPATGNAVGDFYFNTATGDLLTWNGTVWSSVTAGALVIIADLPPANPVIGRLWWDSAGGHLYVWMNDGTTSQWVATNPS